MRPSATETGDVSTATHLPPEPSKGQRHKGLPSAPEPASVIAASSRSGPSRLTVAAAVANVSVNVLRLLTFGGLGIEADNGTAAPRLRPPRLALLAVLAAMGDRGASRERLAALFWPESEEERARHSLRQTLYALRNELGEEIVRPVGSTLTLDDNAIRADVVDFRVALAQGERERAVTIARGPFLEGFYLPGASTFERWVEEERSRLGTAAIAALLSLATDATRANGLDAAVEWWGQLTARDPLSGRFALGYLKALAACGDRAAALAFARQHEALVRRELETDPDPDIRRLEAELRAIPSPDIARPPNGNGNGYARPVDKERPATAPIVAEPEVPVASTPRPTEHNEASARQPSRRWHARLMALRAATVMVLVVGAALIWLRAPRRGAAAAPTFAVGFIRDDGSGDSLRAGHVLTDMIATNLARVEGLTVLANSRLLELMRPGQDSAAGYSSAARRAGATELLEGQLRADGPGKLALEVRRVDVQSGIVKDVYRVVAADRGGLVDSLTRVISRRFNLTSPNSSVVDVTTSSATAYRLYTEGLRAYYQSDLRGAQRLMHAAVAEDSTMAMGWYYVDKLHWLSVDPLLEGRAGDPRKRALQYAARLSLRERLTISADLLGQDYDEHALALAESLTTKFPTDPRGHTVLGKVRMMIGDWAGAVAATERAIARDSAAEDSGAVVCRLCEDFAQLADTYLWWDSLPAVTRTAERYRALRPRLSQPFFYLGLAAERRGDSASAYSNFRQLALLGGTTATYKTGVDLALEVYDQVEEQLRPQLESAPPDEWDDWAWSYLLLLRNEGRLREAQLFNRTGTLPGLASARPNHTPQIHHEGILALATGQAAEAARVFKRLRSPDMSLDPPGVQARVRAWSGTLEGMARAAAGDTGAVRALADSVERWGAGSAYGRDRKSHHYLRGLLLAAVGRHEQAVGEFRAAIHSPSQGFTRVNYELARSLMQLGRPQEAVSTLQAALRGDLWASCLYVTHTELHELLAQAFESAGMVDSAAVHYRAVVKAWQRADPEFVPRRDAAQRWLARHMRLVATITSTK